jgi:hypothetical protein
LIHVRIALELVVWTCIGVVGATAKKDDRVGAAI